MSFRQDENHKVITLGHINIGAQVLTIGIKHTIGLVDGQGNKISPEIVLLIDRESHEPIQIDLGNLQESSQLISLLVDARLQLQK